MTEEIPGPAQLDASMGAITEVSACCEGERCFCGQPASAKVEETIFHDDWSMRGDGPNGSLPPIMRGRHPLTAYICAEHFAQIMHRRVPAKAGG